ncbi:MAG: hypothetical protein ACREUU_01680, partial [Gammaproteobacteria bacterium]
QQVLSATVSCQPGNRTIVLTGSEWENVRSYSTKRTADMVCFSTLKDPKQRKAIEAAFKANAALPR